jgi:hypothetical protein
MHFIFQHSKQLNDDWNKAMDLVSNRALSKLTDNTKQNALIPVSDTEAVNGLQILLYSSYWTSALHHLGITPGIDFPDHSNLRFTVLKDSHMHIKAINLGFMDSAKMLHNVPIGSMFESNKVFIGEQIRASRVYKTTNNTNKKNTKVAALIAQNKSAHPSQGNDHHTNNSFEMDIDELEQLPGNIILDGSASDEEEDIIQDDEMDRNSDDVTEDIIQSDKSDDETENTTQDDQKGDGSDDEAEDIIMDVENEGDSDEEAKNDVDEEDDTRKKRRGPRKLPKSNAIVISDSEDDQSIEPINGSFAELRYLSNTIPTFQALMLNGKMMVVEKPTSRQGFIQSGVLENQNILGLAKLLSSLMNNSDIRQASRDEEWIGLATRSLATLANKHNAEMGQEKSDDIEKKQASDYYHLFGSSDNINSSDAIQKAVEVMEKDVDRFKLNEDIECS